jgi:hypothetical protein
MSNLVAFLTARLDEDEHRARYAADRDPVDSRAPGGWGGWWYGHYMHYSRYSPERALAEVAAKRAIVDLEILRYCDNVPRSGFISDQVAGRIIGRADTKGLRLLAQPFRSHPDFDPAWEV